MATNLFMKKLLTVLFFLVTVKFAFAQEPSDQTDSDEKHKPSLMLGVSALKFQGYVGSHSDLNPVLDTRLGYFLSVEQRFGKILGVEVTGLYGKLAGTDNSATSHMNFQSQIMQGHIMLTANFDRVFKEDPAVSPFINVGIGYMMFTSYSDMKDKNGKAYNYWKDGSIRDQPDSTQYQATAAVIKRDYTYETQLKTNNVTGCLVVPVGGGLNFHLGSDRRWTTSIGVNYTMCFTNWIDNSGQGSNSYISGNVGIQYEFSKKKSSGSSDRYNNVDFSSVDHLDADKDGVPDDKDDCHGTPVGAKVDKRGCPLDSDGDGVPDYLDKEPNTPKGNKVDGYGVTINESELAAHQLAWDSLAPERSKEFNVAPSKAYLEKIEAEAKKVRGKSNTAASKIPADLKAADLNNDGYISADEITKTIDSFFEGSTDFTVEKINKLIDYFFEQ
jgi:hypothetical protein